MTAEHAAAAGGEEFLARVWERRRSRLVVEIDLDPVPGWGNNAEDHRALVQRQLDYAVPHYHPAVTIAAAPTAADTVLATARRICCGDNPAPEHNARADHSQRMAFAEELARAVRGS